MGQKLYEGDVDVDVDGLVDAASQSQTGIEWSPMGGKAVAAFKKGGKNGEAGYRAAAAKKLLGAIGVGKSDEPDIPEPDEED